MGTALEIDQARLFGYGGRRVLVTGATGFLGVRLVGQLLRMGALVYGLVYERLWHLPPHPGLFQIEGDLRSRDDVERLIAVAEPELVFHLAALTQVTEVERIPALGYATNVGGLVNLLDVLRAQNVIAKVIVASSDKAFGEIVGEAGGYHVDNPIHPYDASKAAGDIIARSYRDFYKMDVTVVRTANVYGPGDRQMRRIVPSTIWSLLQGQPPRLRSDGTPVREYLFIDDAIEAYLRAAESVRSHRFPLVVAGIRINVSDLVSLITAVMGSDLKPVFMDVPFTETRSIMLDPLACVRDLGEWERTNLHDGIERTVAWMQGLKDVGVEQEGQWEDTLWA